MNFRFVKAYSTFPFYGFLAIAVSVLVAIAPFVPVWAQEIFSSIPTAEQRTLMMLAEQGCLPVPAPHIAPAYEFSMISSIRDTRAEVQQNLSLGRDFYYVRVHSPWEVPDYPWETLVSVDGYGTCTNLIGQRSGGVTLTTFMPPPLAGQLALAKYQQLAVTAEGEGQINRILGQFTPDPDALNSDLDMDVWIAPEDAWALTQMGYSIPEEFNEYPTQIPYQEREGNKMFFNHLQYPPDPTHSASLFESDPSVFHFSDYAQETLKDLRSKA